MRLAVVLRLFAAIALESLAHVNGYLPNIPNSYTQCLFDPYEQHTIVVFSRQDGTPWAQNGTSINSGGLNYKDLESLPSYQLVPGFGSPRGVFDLVSQEDGLLVSVFDDGHVGLVGESPEAAGLISSIWSVECDGTVRAGIMGGSEFVFGTLESGLDVHIEEIPADVSRKTGGFIKSETSKIVNKLYPAFIPTHFLGEKQTMLRRAQGSPADRCDGQLAPITKFDAPPLSTNGCGTGIFKYDYRPFKEAECCVHHDYCWEECDNGYDQCNANFRECVFDSCERLVSGMERIPCYIMASTYASIVESPIGRTVFYFNNNVQCACCPAGYSSCPIGCALTC